MNERHVRVPEKDNIRWHGTANADAVWTHRGTFDIGRGWIPRQTLWWSVQEVELVGIQGRSPPQTGLMP